MKKTTKVVTASLLALTIAGNSIPYNVFAEEVVTVEDTQLQDSEMGDNIDLFQNRAQQLISDKLALDIYANTILAQGTIKQIQFNDDDGKLVTVPIDIHQATAKQNASYWRDDLEPKMIKLNNDIRSSADDFQYYSDYAIEYLNSSDIDSAKEMIEAMIDETNDNVTNVNNTIEDMKAFSTDLTKDSTDLKSDKDQLDTWLGKNGEDGYAIDQLNKDIANFEKQMDSLRQQELDVALASAGAGVALWIGAGVVLAVAPETSPWIIGGMAAGGILAVGGGVGTSVGVYQSKINDVKREYIAAMDELTDLQKQSAGFKIAEEQVSLMVDKIDKAIVALNDVKDTWVTLQNDLGYLLDHLTTADTNVEDKISRAKAELKISQSKWAAVYADTNLLNTFGQAVSVADLDAYQFDAPTNLTANSSNASVTLNWDKPTFASKINGDNITYDVSLDGVVKQSKLTNTSVVLSGDNAPTGEHTYTVRAFDGTVYSDVATITITN
ncbi:HBL/NHE enterotoxin family protein [Cytobacillus sp. IB215316]|uniref:HBL/NHE enterotoxin family protein n=1 Tax=Cytobacillus sp. IB215316 TaxID=3097354 RepID=UPI002A14CCD1|nr:HBL/NHE enterotoxin family protein [Cytobacillus sp. IB215316]MDX8360925.1 HBL/NHE enterotoxin family protein [Cytobacillus sp. IB215316]